MTFNINENPVLFLNQSVCMHSIQARHKASINLSESNPVSSSHTNGIRVRVVMMIIHDDDAGPNGWVLLFGDGMI